MKIGILTFHRAHNYGAVLQCYALQEYLVSQKYEVCVIDYVPEWMQRLYKWNGINKFSIRHPRGLLKNILYIFSNRRRYINFESFILKYLKLFHFSSENDFTNFDVIIIGSDQVWNKKITMGYDNYYWGNFKTNNKHKIIAYAPSMDEVPTKLEEICLIKKLLDNFNSISVRELELKKYLSSITDHTINLTIDPTFLLSPNIWLKLTENIKSMYGDYLFFYQARPNTFALDYARKQANNLRVRFIYLSSMAYYPHSKGIGSSGPLEFLSLIRNAKYVITTSFHGTAFSILMNIQFTSLMLNDGKDSRIKSLLRILALSDRMKSLNEDICLSEIKWDEVNKTLEHFVNDSKEYLCKALSVS